jgi:hypothetical protein
MPIFAANPHGGEIKNDFRFTSGISLLGLTT